MKKNKQNTEPSEGKRVVFEFSKEAYESLSEMVKTTEGCKNKADVVRQGLSLLEYWKGKLTEGYSFCLKKNESIQEIEVQL